MPRLIQVLTCLIILYMIKNIALILHESSLQTRVWKSRLNISYRIQSFKNFSLVTNVYNDTVQNQSTAIMTTQPEITLENLLSSLPDPVFVMYGNQGYSSLIKNFVCNMALFPPMHKHILIIVDEKKTAEMITSLSSDISVWVSPTLLTASYDFETPDYIRLMLQRGQLLLNLLELSQNQGKTVVWIEPDFHYSQNLLLRPEITQTVSDVVLFWDHNNFCGCFIRFAPVQGALLFYREIIQRMEQNQQDGGMTNDQVILNSVVAELLPNYTLFDPCLYRSGMSIKIKKISRNDSDCKGIQPVAQHHNWIIGLQNKEMMAREQGGWFLHENGKACSTRDLRLMVMTMNRAWSLDRLLKSLQSAEYPPGSTVDLHVTVDRDYDGNVDESTMKLLGSIEWTRGIYEVKVWQHKVGLYGQWVDAWEAELYPDNLYRAVILVEDDLEMSPNYFKWFVGAHEQYGWDERVGAITGQRPSLVAAIDGPPSVESAVPQGVKAFGYMLMATWSLSPKPQIWREFRKWVKLKRAEMPEFIPSVPGIVPDKWYTQFRSRGEEENMWEMWFIRFVHDRGLFTVYPWINGGRETIVGNWKEAGLHFSGKPMLDFPVSQTWDNSILEQAPLPLVGYNLQFPVIGDEWKPQIPSNLRSIMLESCISDICKILATSSASDLSATLSTLGTRYEERERQGSWGPSDVLDIADVMIQQDGDVVVCNTIQHLQKFIGSRGCKLEDTPADQETLCASRASRNTHDKVIVTSQMWGDGYFHTLVEGLPRLVSALEFLKFNKETEHEWVMHSMAPSHLAQQIADFFAIKGFTGGPVYAKRALIASPTPCGGSLKGKQTRLLRSYIHAKLSTLEPKKRHDTTLVVIKRSSSRSLLNHDAILARSGELWHAGEVVEHTGKESFREQLALFHSASAVIGPHGAGLANAVAMQENTNIIEVIPETGTNRLNMCYAALAFALKIQYTALRVEGFDSDGAAVLPITVLEQLSIFHTIKTEHKPKRILIDLGANCGNSYEHFKNDIDEAFLIEPQHSVFTTWLIPRASSHVHVYQAAVSDHDEDSVPFFIDVPFGSELCSFDRGYPHGASSLYKDKATVDARSPTRQSVKMIDIARFMTDIVKPRPVDHVILKIDIEGSETAVLKRMIDTQTINLVDSLYVEWHPGTEEFRTGFEKQTDINYQEWIL